MSLARRLLLCSLLLLGSLVGMSALQPTSAAALSGSQFQAGRIMDDGIFFNPGGFSASDIQNFLNAKVPVCDTNGTQNSTHWNGSRYWTRAEWGAMNGNPAPYTCLKNYVQAIPSVAADAYCSGAIGPGTTAVTGAIQIA